ncbi:MULTISPECIES: hypothetical protein [Paraclostridium]|uniref:hypothetical protein n=1 Tax=Paraclostridium TaxID=1849822 RepID=UPI00051D0A33|nr:MULTISPECIES: hypothetical protein [Paraclostridium]KGJ49466.1 hypothetical protein KD33_09245 [Clostridium sp. NCR]MCU9811490.1 hypothetical protein [Paraclostridium sp. AKS81]
MDRNYWQEYWDNYWKFMAVYLRELQDVRPDVDIKNEYLEVASLLEPSMNFEDYEIYDEYDDNSDSEIDTEVDFMMPDPAQSPAPFISPGGGQFTISNCRRMAIVRIVMRRGFTPSNFFLVVDRADRRSIQGFRIACEAGRIRFVPMAVEYRNINFIECAF